MGEGSQSGKAAFVESQLQHAGEEANDGPKMIPQNIHGCQGFVGRDEQVEASGFRAVKTLWADVVAFVQPTEHGAPGALREAVDSRL